jgi:alkyl hydroperoxide reductase subunit AhpC
MPCINALPALEQLYDRFDREDFEIVSVSVEENEALWRNALQRFPQPWPQLYDGTGFDQETFTAYRAGSIPFYVLIDREGIILRNNDFKPDELSEILEGYMEKEKEESAPFAQN